MTKFKELKEDNILGESQYYKVQKIVKDQVQLMPDGGSPIVVDKGYVELYLNSADQFETTEQLTKTQLAELFINNPRLVMTVAFFKQDKAKTKKAYKVDLTIQAEQVQKDFLAKGVSAIVDALASPVLAYTVGKLREMRGRHYGAIDDLGRIQFTDMDVEGDHNARQVDPRTIQFLIVNNIRYTLK